MSPTPDPFFGKALSISLTPAEKDSLKEKLRLYVRNGNDKRLEHHMDQKTFLSAAQGLRLSASEKARMREALFADMERTAPQTVRSFGNLLRIFSGCMAAVMIFVLAGAGVSYAAESSLPGDTLYPVKVNLTEPLLLRFNNSIEAKVRVRARLATRRLDEAHRLAERSQLTADRLAIVNERLIGHINALESDLKELEKLNKESTATIAVEASADMQAHENVLLRIVSDEERIRVANLLMTTRKARKIADAATESAHADTVRLTKATAEKAEKAILKAKAVQHTADNVIVTDTLRNAEDDLRASGDIGASVRVNIEKAASALRQAKEVNLMLGIKGRAILRQNEKETVVPVPEDPTEPDAGHEADEQSSGGGSFPAVLSSSSTESSDASSTSSSTHTSSSASTSSADRSSTTSSSAVSVSASASISASASASASVGDVLKKTDDLIKKTLPKKI